MEIEFSHHHCNPHTLSSHSPFTIHHHSDASSILDSVILNARTPDATFSNTSIHLDYSLVDMSTASDETYPWKTTCLTLSKYTSLHTLQLNFSRAAFSVNEIKFLCDSMLRLPTLYSLDLNLSQNSFSDSGYDLVHSCLSSILSLTSITLNFDHTALRKRGLSMLTLLNSIPNIESLNLSVSKNQFAIESELREILPTFKDTSVFSQLKSLTVCFDECEVTLAAQPQNSSMNSSNSALTSNIQHFQNLQNYLNQLRNNNYPESHAQVQQCLQQLAITQANILKLQQAPTSTKKTVLTKLLELMLRFTSSLQHFKLECPGELLTEASLEQFAQLIKIKQSSVLQSFELRAKHSVEFASPNAADFFFFELGKLTQLKHLCLELQCLNTSRSLQLKRFLGTLSQLESLEINLNRLHELSTTSDILTDIAEFLYVLNKQLKNMRSLNLNVSHSSITDNNIISLGQSISELKKTLFNFKINISNCVHLTDRVIEGINSMLDSNQFQAIHVDLSQNRISPLGVTTILQTCQKSSATLSSLIVHAQMKRSERGGSPLKSLDASVFSQMMESFRRLKKCIVNVGGNTQRQSNALKEKAEDTNRLLKQAQCLLGNTLLTKNFRREIVADLMDFYLPI